MFITQSCDLGPLLPHIPRDQTNEWSYYKFLSLDDCYVLFNPFICLLYPTVNIKINLGF